MLLYADENFPRPVVILLRAFGHDVLTVQEDSRSGSDDDVVLARAQALQRVVLTQDRRDYERLHRAGEVHSGIVSVTYDADIAALSERIHHALQSLSPGPWCYRINRPPPG